MKDLETLASQLEQVAAWARGEGPDLAWRTESVSNWSVAQQVDHINRVNRGVLRALLLGKGPVPGRISMLGRLALGMRYIPRGVGKAPDRTQGQEAPPENLTSAAIANQELLREFVGRPELLADPRPVLAHPIFGGLSAVQSVRFLAVHTRHHFKIVRDIARGR